MKASLKNYRQSPRKVRLVTDLVKGKKVSEALVALSLLPKRAAAPVKKLIESAVANAKDKGIESDELIVDNATVDEGIVLKRFQPRAFGRATMIRKRTSHIDVTLSAPEGVEASADSAADNTDDAGEQTQQDETPESETKKEESLEHDKKNSAANA